MLNYERFDISAKANFRSNIMDTNFDKKIFIKNFRENCNKIQIKKISKGETVTSYIEKRNQICIILSGEVDLIRYDVNGNKTIIGRFNENDVFGEVFYPANTNNELFAVEKKILKYYILLMILYLQNVNAIVLFIKN